MRKGRSRVAIEVKSGRRRDSLREPAIADFQHPGRKSCGRVWGSGNRRSPSPGLSTSLAIDNNTLARCGLDKQAC
jgi:hypothetical protein